MNVYFPIKFMTKPSAIRHYIYFDEIGIERLFSQISLYEERELTVSRLDKSSEISKRTIVSKLSGSLLAMGFNVSGKKEDNEQYDRGTELKQALFKPNEQKLLQFEDYVRSNDQYLTISDSSTALKLTSSSLPAFCRLQELPLIVKADSSDGIYEQVLKEQFVVMEAVLNSGNTIKFFVAAGLSKFDSVKFVNGQDKYHFSRTSHLAILLRQMASEPTRLNVFGHIRIAMGNIHIKPFAIWF